MNEDEVNRQEDVRAEYAAIVDYHNALINTRFTIAALYVAGVGFVAGAIFGAGATWSGRIGAAWLVGWLTVCFWVLELRSRALYVNLAHRGIEIEHEEWGLVAEKWYSGFFSRQYKEPPSESSGGVQKQPGPDCPKLGWRSRPLSPRLSKWISHSLGLDLLYAGSGVFWFGTFVISAIALVLDW